MWRKGDEAGNCFSYWKFVVLTAEIRDNTNEGKSLISAFCLSVYLKPFFGTTASC